MLSTYKKKQKKYICILRMIHKYKVSMKGLEKLTSSTNTTLGAILLASEKTAFTYFSPSPNHCSEDKTQVKVMK
jgi:hypothetical protein